MKLPDRFLNWFLSADGRKLPCRIDGTVCDAHDPANHVDYHTAAASLDYNPQTGVLVWRERPETMFRNRQAWLSANTRFAGKPITHINSTGYIALRLNYRQVLAHRIIFLLDTGMNVPTGYEIDHMNGLRTDNRISNLRCVDRTANSQNSAIRCDNTSGVVGVHWQTKARKWNASIKVNGVHVHLGLFADIETATHARKVAEIKYGFHPNHGRAK